jgi:hypothetical protein
VMSAGTTPPGSKIARGFDTCGVSLSAVIGRTRAEQGPTQ